MNNFMLRCQNFVPFREIFQEEECDLQNVQELGGNPVDISGASLSPLQILSQPECTTRIYTYGSTYMLVCPRPYFLQALDS